MPGSSRQSAVTRGAAYGFATPSVLFVGQWAPTFLILGLYNKLVKLLGSD